MQLIRDPRPGVSWRVKRLRRQLRARFKNSSTLDSKTQFRVAWGRHWYDQDVKDNLVVYESFSGNGALCNPRAIFDELLATEDMSHLRHVWCFSSLPVKVEFDKQFARHPRVRSVLTATVEYYGVLSTAKYLVNNATFPPAFTKRDEQVYLNTWHGTPLKRMGYDSPEGPFGSRNTVRNFLAADYLLSPNEYTTTQMYEQGYRLKGIYRGTVVEEGYPRIDAQFRDGAAGHSGNPVHSGQPVVEELRRAGVSVAGEKIVLYAPTWKGTSFSSPRADVAGLVSDVETFSERLGPDYTVLLKVHQQIFDAVAEHAELRKYLVPNSIPTNKVLSCVDVLVTDYSSIFFDFLVSGRPILFYVPDASVYERDRGLYFDLSELPGPTFRTSADLIGAVKEIGTGSDEDPLLTHGDAYRTAAKTYCPKDDGNATARVIDIVFRGRTDGYGLIKGLQDERTSILVSAGRSRPNGISASVQSLLHNLDKSVYDVTLFVQPPQNDAERAVQAAMPDTVRQLVRTGTFPTTAERLRRHNEYLTTGLNRDGSYPGDEQRVLAAEWNHSFGLSTFDHAIDFGGYAPFWPSVFLQGDVGTRSIWMHNDLIADSQREVDGERFLQESLTATFTLYRHYDHLVSVSPSLAAINAEGLKDYAPVAKFGSAHNTINVEQIRALAKGPDLPGVGGQPDIRVDQVPLSVAAAQFVRSYPVDGVVEEISRQATLARLMPDGHDSTTFVTAGRLSPEKNHARMIRAFADVHRENPRTRLLILGDGPLMGQLERLVSRLELNDVVVLAGHQTSPYALMAASDCFVLSSNYEGQPMVILEALTLGLPVVTVEFGSAASALPNNGGLLVPQSDAGLADGMRAFLRGEVSMRDFDAAEYNRSAVAEFVASIGA